MSNNVTGWNAMVTAAAATGGTCYLPGGKACFNGDLSMAPNVNIIGQGCGSSNIGFNPPALEPGATVLQMRTANKGPSFLQTFVAPGPTNESWYWNGGRLAGFDLDGDSVGTFGMDLRGMSQGHLNSILLYNWTSACLRLDACVNNQIERLSFRDSVNGVTADEFDPGTGFLLPNFNWINNCEFNGITGWGIDWRNFSSLRVSNSNFSNGGSGGSQPTNSGNIQIVHPNQDGSGIGLISDHNWMEGIKGGYGIYLGASTLGTCHHAIYGTVVQAGSPGYYGVFLASNNPHENHLTTFACQMTGNGHADVSLSPDATVFWHKGPGLYSVTETTSATVTTWG